MEEGKIVVLVPEEKTFKVNRLKFRGIKDSEFKGPISDCSYLALWYYNNKNIHAKKLTNVVDNTNPFTPRSNGEISPQGLGPPIKSQSKNKFNKIAKDEILNGVFASSIP